MRLPKGKNEELINIIHNIIIATMEQRAPHLVHKIRLKKYGGSAIQRILDIGWYEDVTSWASGKVT